MIDCVKHINSFLRMPKGEESLFRHLRHPLGDGTSSLLGPEMLDCDSLSSLHM